MTIQQLKETIDKALERGLHPTTPVKLNDWYETDVVSAHEKLQGGTYFVLDTGKDFVQ